jgi:hypothetical protein
MISESFKHDLLELDSKCERLKYDIRLANFAITEHFLDVKSDIDAQAETLIARINEKRIQLFAEIDSYEKQSLAKYSSQSGEAAFARTLDEIKSFTSKWLNRQTETNEPIVESQTGLYRKKIDESLQQFNILKFSNSLMVFEKSIDVCLGKSIDRLFGALIFKPVSDDKILKNYKLNGVKYDFSDKCLLPYSKLCESSNMKANTDCSEFLKLTNGKYVHIQRYFRQNLRIGVFTDDFTHCFVSLNLIKTVSGNFSLPCVCAYGTKFVLCLEDHSVLNQPRTLVLVFDEHLNRVREALIDGIYFTVVANTANIVLLCQNTLMNRVIVCVYDWTVQLRFIIDSDEAQSRFALRHLDLDDTNRLFLQFRDAFHVLDLDESRKTVSKHLLRMENRRKSNFISFRIYDKSTLCLVEGPATLVFIDCYTCEVLREMRIDLDLETRNSSVEYSLRILDICRERVVLFDPVSNSVQVFRIDAANFKI